MGFQDKHQYEGGVLETETGRWVIAGMSVRTTAPLQRIRTTKQQRNTIRNRNSIATEEHAAAAVVVETEDHEEDEELCTTPKGSQLRIPEKLVCPAAPRKQRSKPSTCHSYLGGGAPREFFNPPDLESVFTRRVR